MVLSYETICLSFEHVLVCKRVFGDFPKILDYRYQTYFKMMHDLIMPRFALQFSMPHIHCVPLLVRTGLWHFLAFYLLLADVQIDHL